MLLIIVSWIDPIISLVHFQALCFVFLLVKSVSLTALLSLNFYLPQFIYKQNGNSIYLVAVVRIERIKIQKVLNNALECSKNC